MTAARPGAPPVPVAAAVMVRGTTVFLARRAPGRRQAGCWEFPGGKVEPGETLQECLERELREELGLMVRAGRVIGENEHGYDHGTVRLIAVETRILSGRPALSVHDRAEWVPADRLTTYPLAPADVPIARAVRRWLISGDAAGGV